MEAVYFLIIWIGSALAHTLYDLKVKPHFDSYKQNSDSWPYV